MAERRPRDTRQCSDDARDGLPQFRPRSSEPPASSFDNVVPFVFNMLKAQSPTLLQISITAIN